MADSNEEDYMPSALARNRDFEYFNSVPTSVYERTMEDRKRAEAPKPAQNSDAAQDSAPSRPAQTEQPTNFFSRLSHRITQILTPSGG